MAISACGVGVKNLRSNSHQITLSLSLREAVTTLKTYNLFADLVIAARE
jgi:hypothetical protein